MNLTVEDAQLAPIARLLLANRSPAMMAPIVELGLQHIAQCLEATTATQGLGIK
jgi:hypothetical protein